MGRYWPGMGSNLRPDLKKLPRVVAIGRSATFVGGTQSSGSVLGLTPSFNPQFANTGSIADTRGNGVPAFLRNTVATVEDHEGILRYALAGEVRFKGLRRVQNLLSATENFADPAWSTGDPVNNPIIPNSPDVAAPDGTFTATKFQINSVALNRSFSQAVGTTTLPGRTFSFSFWVWIPNSNSPNPWSAYMFTGLDIPVDPVNLNALPRSRWNRVTYKHTWSGAATNGVSAQFHGNFADTVGDKIYVWHPQLEEITGQSIQIPAEYVSTGVQVAPIYHGAAVDGVKYFPWTNGNTLSGSIVNEAFGTLISSTTRKGYFSESTRTNLLLQSNAFTTAPWGGTTAPIQDTVGPDGLPNSAWTITDADPATFKSQSQAIVVPNDNSTYVFSIYVKKTSGGTSGVFAVNFNLTGGVPVTINARWDTDTGLSGNAGAAVPLAQSLPNYWRFFVVITNNTSGNTGLSASIFPASGVHTPVPTSASDNAAGVGTAVVFGAVLEQASVASSCSFNAAVVLPKSSDDLQYSNIPLMAQAVGSAFATVQMDQMAGCVSQMIMRMGDNNGRPLWFTLQVETEIASYDGVSVNSKSPVPDIIAAPQKVASSWGPAGMSVTSAGIAPTTSAFDGTMGPGNLSLGIGVNNFFGSIAEARIYPYQLTDSMLQQLTT